MAPIKSVCVFALLASVACHMPLAVNGYRVHSTSSANVPSRPATYPHVAYDDGVAYLVGSEWIYRDSTYGWVVFDQEPPALHAYRVRTYALETHTLR
jgi:hypothetical protein